MNPILHLQRTIGNQTVQRILQTKTEALEVGLADTALPRFAHDFSPMPLHPNKSRNIQAKLMVSSRGDIYEQEADHVSEQVIRMSEPQLQRACPCDGGCPKCRTQQRDQEQVRLQTRHTRSGDLEHTVVPAIVHEVLRSPGQPLDPVTRRFMEHRFGHDFSHLRVHTEGKAAESSDTVRATAYTVGQNIVFGNGQYAPQAAEGQRLLAHELAHVIQQGTAGPQVDPVRNVPVGPPGGVDEHSADGADAGKESRRSGPPTTWTALQPGAVGLMLQRQAVDPRELKTETINTPRQFKISQWLVELAPGGGTSLTELYRVDFEVDYKGIMTGSVRTVLPDRTYRSGVLRFGDSFRDALQHFQTNGVEVSAFEGDWSYMTEDEISDNLRVFREEMGGGKTREAAALKTPTAQGRDAFRLRTDGCRERSGITATPRGEGRATVASQSDIPPPADSKERSWLGHRRRQGEVIRSLKAPGGDGERRVHVGRGERRVPVEGRVVRSCDATGQGCERRDHGVNGAACSKRRCLARRLHVGPWSERRRGSIGSGQHGGGVLQHGFLNFPIALRNSKGDEEVHTVRISDKGFEEVSSTLISKPLPRDIKTLTPADAERTLKEGDYFIKKSRFSKLDPWFKRILGEAGRTLENHQPPRGTYGVQGIP